MLNLLEAERKIVNKSNFLFKKRTSNTSSIGSLHMLLIRKILIILLFSIPSIGYSQSCEIFADSLEYAWDIRNNEFEKSINIIQSVLKNIEPLKCKKIKGTSYNYWGIFLFERGFHEKAIKKLEVALKIRSSLKDSIGMAGVLNNMSYAESEKGNDENAIKFAIQSIQILENLSSSEGLGNTYLTLSLIYEKNKDRKNAITYNQKALDLFVLHEDTANIGNAVYQLANKYYNFENFDTAKIKYTHALTLFKKVKDNLGVAMCYDALGNISIKDKSYSEAEKQLKIAKEIYSEIKDTFGLFYNHFNVSKLFFEQESYRLALEYSIKADSFLSNVGGLKEELMLVKFQGKIYEVRGNHKLALDLKTKELILKDSLFNIEKSKQIDEIQTKYETEKLKRENAETEVENQQKTIQRNSLLGLSFLLLFSIIGATTYFKKRQKALKIINAQQKEIHENEIDDILSDQEIKFIAAKLEGREMEREHFYEELHHNISNQLVNVTWKYKELQENIKEPSLIVPLEKANSLLNNVYKDISDLLEKFRSGNVDKIGLKAAVSDFCQTINGTNNLEVCFSSYGNFQGLDNQVELWLYRVAQELLGNVLKYAKATEVEVSLNRHPQKISLIVADNGIGFDESKITKGTGLKGLKNKIENLEGNFQIDSGPKIGTTIFVNIPIEEAEII